MSDVAVMKIFEDYGCTKKVLTDTCICHAKNLALL